VCQCAAEHSRLKRVWIEPFSPWLPKVYIILLTKFVSRSWYTIRQDKKNLHPKKVQRKYISGCACAPLPVALVKTGLNCGLTKVLSHLWQKPQYNDGNTSAAAGACAWVRDVPGLTACTCVWSTPAVHVSTLSSWSVAVETGEKNCHKGASIPPTKSI